MQFLISVIDDTSNSGTQDEIAAINVFNDGLRAAGHWVFAGGLNSPEEAVVIDNRSGASLLSQGAFQKSTEYTAGFWIIVAQDLSQALLLAADGSKACNRKVEVRELHGE